ncbi:unnamed protein product [Camellia sinensis]
MDNIATKDKLNTTAGSYALLSSVVARDARVVAKLRKAGAIVLGKVSMTKWVAFRSYELPNGWCARASQVVNPYVKSADPCGSSTGSTVSVAANMVTLSLGTETAGSILCPSSFNSVVGIKPTVGLTSRGGVVPISPRQDTVGTVSDAVYVLDAIVGFDFYDAVATRKASKYITHDGYVQFLKVDGLRGKTLGITSYPFFGFTNNSDISQAFKLHFNTLRQRGAILVDGLDIPNFAAIMNSVLNDQDIALLAEFRLKLMKENKLDALVTPFSYDFLDVSSVLAIGGIPGISVPAGYDHHQRPFGICFGGLKGYEPKLIEIAYSFEQATKIRKPPLFRP